MQVNLGPWHSEPDDACAKSKEARGVVALIDPDLLEILVCPEDKTPVHLAEAGLIEKLNAAQKEGRLKNRAGEAVKEAMEGGLVREDGKYLYAILDGIPVMLIEEGIPLEGFLD